MDRILRNTAGQITLTLYDQDGEPLTASGVDVLVTDAAGAVVVVSTAATEVPDADAVWGLELTPTQTAALGTFTATWSATIAGVVNTYTTRYEVVGGFLFTIAEARAFDGGALADAVKYPASLIVAGRSYVEDYLEHLTGVSFVPRRKRVVIDGAYSSYVRVPDFNLTSLVSASLADEEIDVADLSLDAARGRVSRVNGTWYSYLYRNAVVLTYEYGFAEPPPAVVRAGLLLLKDKLVGSNIDPKALTFSDDLGTRSLAVPGDRFPTGIPEVAEIVKEYGQRQAVLH